MLRLWQDILFIVCDIIATGVVYLQFIIVLMYYVRFKKLVSIYKQQPIFFTRYNKRQYY